MGLINNIDNFVCSVLTQLNGYVKEGDKITFDLSLISPFYFVPDEVAIERGVGVDSCINMTTTDTHLPHHRNSVQFSVEMPSVDFLNNRHDMMKRRKYNKHDYAGFSEQPSDKEQEQKI